MISWIIFLFKNFRYLINYKKDVFSDSGSFTYDDYNYLHSLVLNDYSLSNIDYDTFIKISKKIMIRINFYYNFDI